MDFNGDGKIDIIAGDSAGQVTVFLNEGTNKKPKFPGGMKLKAGGKEITATRRTYKKEGNRYVVDKTIGGSHKLADSYTKIHYADWNDDGLKDLLVGHNSTMIVYYNKGTKTAPKFDDPVEITLKSGRFPMRPSPYVVDWDGDGKKDILAGSDGSQVVFCKNVGTNAKPQLDKCVPIDLKLPKGSMRSYRWRFDITDWNKDGKKDLLLGDYCSGTKEGKRVSSGNVWLFLGK